MKNTWIKFSAVVLCFMAFHFSSFAQQQAPPAANPDAQFPAANAFANSNIIYKITDAPNKTFCYDIYADDKLMIHQTSIPGMPGNDGFKTKDAAEKVAQLVISKIRKGEMPPTVTTEELKALNVIQ